MAYRVLVPQPGIELKPPALEAQKFNNWTAREVPTIQFQCCHLREAFLFIYLFFTFFFF